MCVLNKKVSIILCIVYKSEKLTILGYDPLPNESVVAGDQQAVVGEGVEGPVLQRRGVQQRVRQQPARARRRRHGGGAGAQRQLHHGDAPAAAAHWHRAADAVRCTVNGMNS